MKYWQCVANPTLQHNMTVFTHTQATLKQLHAKTHLTNDAEVVKWVSMVAKLAQVQLVVILWYVI